MAVNCSNFAPNTKRLNNPRKTLAPLLLTGKRVQFHITPMTDFARIFTAALLPWKLDRRAI
jgi:hypothetical protein